MSIETSRNRKTFVTDRKVFIGNDDSPSFSVISSSHFKNVLGSGINVHRDRLSEWTPLGDAIVGPA
jgi:hypothetical protein